MNKKEIYFNFPIQILAGFMNDKETILTDIVYYSLYIHSLKLESGTALEKIKASADYFGVNVNFELCLSIGKHIDKNTNQHSPSTGLKKQILFDYLKNDKSEFEKACLLGYLAIKSIIGPNKPYCKITNLYLWSRMDGKVKSVTDISELSEEVRKYANRYQTEKIKEELILNWSLIHYSQFTRGFYVSFSLSLEDLIFEAEKRRKSLKQKQQKQILNEAKEKALERLKNLPP